MSELSDVSTASTLSPLDGRYASQLTDVTALFSGNALVAKRLKVEITWFIQLVSQLPPQEIAPLQTADLKFLQDLTQPTPAALARIARLEQQLKHDIKAVECYLREEFANHPTLHCYREFIHFACTSDDINNLSYGSMMAEARTQLLLPDLQALIDQLTQMAKNFAAIPMAAHTHGQIASPTTFGKEMANFAYRLVRQQKRLAELPILGKFNGAVGNFNAHYLSYPELDWQAICQQLVENLALEWNPYTTQIEPHDWLAEYCDVLRLINTIAIGLCRDIWGYISLGYLAQPTHPNEVGSSTMPHKVNPIQFENAEGNLGIANALLEHYSNKLPISRWQRDLSDSTVLRNLGVAIGHTILAYRALTRGLQQLTVNSTTLATELDQHWEILAEAVQTMMRRFKIEAPYEQLKKLTRGRSIDANLLQEFIRSAKLPVDAQNQLLTLTPDTYLGKAIDLANNLPEAIHKIVVPTPNQ